MPRPRRLTLPPDPEGLNDRRARWANAAIREFEAVTGTDRQDVVADLLCNLRHWCDRHGMSFSRENERAARNYRDETTPDPEDFRPQPEPLTEFIPDAAAHPQVGPDGIPLPPMAPTAPPPENDVPF